MLYHRRKLCNGSHLLVSQVVDELWSFGDLDKEAVKARKKTDKKRLERLERLELWSFGATVSCCTKKKTSSALDLIMRDVIVISL